ncbi:hypothetical protein BCR44DRAFT_1500017 [Catenaria anguillulae PL171]|uniref:K Homology domain-containing protein n=1 Tax=Catenaria anguillulae PL171 TaxID=765915 RepID=A0A1Y2HKR2_9FUNG|nr:hypothetical protein BCR44DRAFT_1500017 [Catenaria anguillulae PL171]
MQSFPQNPVSPALATSPGAAAAMDSVSAASAAAAAAAYYPTSADTPAATPAAQSAVPAIDTSNAIVTLRVLLTTKGAGVCIGVKGATIDALRTHSGCRAGVTKLVEGVNDRVLSVSGSVAQCAKAIGFIANTLTQHPVMTFHPELPESQTVLRLLVPNAVMGSIIGRGGANIKAMQDALGVRIVTSKDMLPGSTERVVDVTGTPQAMEQVGADFARSIAANWDRVMNDTRLYDPRVRMMRQHVDLHHAAAAHHHHHSAGTSPMGSPYGSPRVGYQPAGVATAGYSPAPMYNAGAGATTSPMVSNPASTASTAPGSPAGASSSAGSADYRTHPVKIPSALVGAIIGRGGARIAEIRKSSGAQILISKNSLPSGEREFTVSGTSRQIELALTMVYEQLAMERDRRVQEAAAKEQQQDGTGVDQQQVQGQHVPPVEE